MVIYELEKGAITYDKDELSSLFYNPLLLKNKHHFASNYNSDPDKNFLDEVNNTVLMKCSEKNVSMLIQCFRPCKYSKYFTKQIVIFKH